MSIPWLIFDCNYMAHRALHSTGDLSYEGKPTGVIFGFLRDVMGLKKQFSDTEKLVFAFDHGVGIREKELSDDYKSVRRKKKLLMNEKEKEVYQGMLDQVEVLKKEYLPRLGFKNVIYQNGYEADDVIANIVKNSNDVTRDGVVIVSSDKDLYQLFRSDVSIYSMDQKKLLTKKWFKKEFDGISPSEWVAVKAIAGCTTDTVIGVDGVGVKTAIQFIKNELPKTYKTYGAIQSFLKTKRYKINLALVKLPLKGMKEFTINDESIVDRDVWKHLMKELGIKSFDFIPERVRPGGFYA